jgi:hypothetical protein
MVNFMAKFAMKLRGSAVAQILVIPALYQRPHDWGLRPAVGGGNVEQRAAGTFLLVGAARVCMCVSVGGWGGRPRAITRKHTRPRALTHTYIHKAFTHKHIHKRIHASRLQFLKSCRPASTQSCPRVTLLNRQSHHCPLRYVPSYCKVMPVSLNILEYRHHFAYIEMQA